MVEARAIADVGIVVRELETGGHEFLLVRVLCVRRNTQAGGACERTKKTNRCTRVGFFVESARVGPRGMTLTRWLRAWRQYEASGHWRVPV